MGNIFRIVILILNVVLYKISTFENIDILISNMIIFNLLSFVLFIYFDKHILISNQSDPYKFKKIIFKGLRENLNNFFNWIVFLFPFALYTVTDLEYYFSEIQTISFTVMILFLKLNIITLSSIIKELFKKTYSVYIVFIGLIFQLYNIKLSNSFTNITIFLVSMIILTFISILIIYKYFSKQSSLQNHEIN